MSSVGEEFDHVLHTFEKLPFSFRQIVNPCANSTRPYHRAILSGLGHWNCRALRFALRSTPGERMVPFLQSQLAGTSLETYKVALSKDTKVFGQYYLNSNSV